MRMHRYRVTLEHLAGPQADVPPRAALTFEVGNHDDIIGIAERVRAGSGLAADEAAALSVGLKLFTEVMLAHRGDPLFGNLHAPIGEFIRGLKARNRQAAGQPAD